MNGLLRFPDHESKTIVFNPEKISNTKSNQTEAENDFFQNFMEALLQDRPETREKDLLIAKLLDLPSDIEMKAKVKSPFSGEKLFRENRIDHVSVETLIEIASILRQHPQIDFDFATDSKTLETALKDPKIRNNFQHAHTIGDLLKLADKHGIKVKNIEFFKEESALDLSAKKMIKKVKSEDILTMIDQQTDQTKRIAQKPVPKSMLQKILSQTHKQEKRPDELTIDRSTQPDISSKKITKELKTESSSTEPSQKNQQIVKHHPERQAVLSKASNRPDLQKSVEQIVQSAQKTEKPAIEQAAQQGKSTESIIQTEKLPRENLPKAMTQPVQTVKNSDRLHTANRLETMQRPKQPHMAKQLNETTQLQVKTETTVHQKDTLSSNPNSQSHQKTEKPAIEQAAQQGKSTESIIQTEKLPRENLPKDMTQPVQTVKNSDRLHATSNEKERLETMQQPKQHTRDTRQITGISIQQPKTTPESGKEPLNTTINRSIPKNELAIGADEQQPSQEHTSVSHETKANQTEHLHRHKTEQTDHRRTLNTFAQEFKEKVESYKPPLMKIKMQLNPGNLGDVDVTLINRGNNLHVNIQSNPNTIAIFTQNQAEFKNALVNMGFSGLQMQFGEQREGNRGQQRGQNGKNQELLTEEQTEMDGFELIVPRYI